MTFDAELHDLAGRAAQAHVHSDGFASGAVRSRVRRARRVYRAIVAGGTMAVIVAVGAGAVAVAQRWPDPAPPAESAVPTPDETDAAPELTTDGVLAGWGDLGVDAGVFGDVVITDAVSVGGRAVVVGCDQSGASGGRFPVWYSGDGVEWRGPSVADSTLQIEGSALCLDQLVTTSHGLFAAGPLGLFRSADGTEWGAVELPGYTDGTVNAVFAAGDRVTVLVSRVSEAESTVADMWTTTDGQTWSQVTDGSAAVFDNGFVADVTAVGGLLVAVGSSPGGAYVPTATAWTSADGLVWQRTTPDGEGFADDAMGGVVAADGGLVAVGTCTDTNQLCAWRSVDGVTWVPEPAPVEDLDPSVSYIEAGAVAAVGDDVYAVGSAYLEAAAVGEPRLWHRAPGGTWESLDPDVVGAVPFAQVEVAGRVVGFWPGQGWPTGGSVRVLTPLG